MRRRLRGTSGPPEEFRRIVRLRDGRQVDVAPLTPADAGELAEAIRTADPETLYQRFCGPPPPVTPELLRHLTELDYVRRFALVARAPNGRGVGTCRYEATSEPGVAEVSAAVDPDWRSVGLASALVRMLAEAALPRGFDRFTATYFATNQPVVELLREADGEQTVVHGNAEAVVQLTL